MSENTSHSVVINKPALTARERGFPVLKKDTISKILDQHEISASDISGKEIEATFIYWNIVRGTHFAPSRRKLKLDELPTKLISGIAIVDFTDEPIDYHYRFFGSTLVEVSGMDLTGKKYFADKIKGYGFVNEKLFPELIARKEPIFHIVKWKSIRGNIYETTSARLPLSEDGENVTGAMTANVWAPSRVL